MRLSAANAWMKLDRVTGSPKSNPLVLMKIAWNTGYAVTVVTERSNSAGLTQNVGAESGRQNAQISIHGRVGLSLATVTSGWNADGSGRI